MKVGVRNSFSRLKEIEEDVSGYGYKAEYVNQNNLAGEEDLWFNEYTGVKNVYEPLEVKVINNNVVWQENKDIDRFKESPKIFKTQFGCFDNYDKGEFGGHLSIHDKDEELIDGNFCDMFDFGEYVWGISNLLHLLSGTLKIIRINKNIDVEVLYDNEFKEPFESYSYLGRIEDGSSCFIVASGSVSSYVDNKQKFDDKTVIFKLDKDGNFEIFREFDFRISDVNSMCMIDDCIYFGRNRLVTVLDLRYNSIKHYTNKDKNALNHLINYEDDLNATFNMFDGKGERLI